MDDFRECANCKYQKGFNIFFKRVKGAMKICLICPNCGQSYDIDWYTTEVKELKADARLKF